MTTMNLLPWRQAMRSRRKKENITTVVVAAFIAACLVFLITLGLSTTIAKEEKNVRYLQDKITSLDKTPCLQSLYSLRQRLLKL